MVNDEISAGTLQVTLGTNNVKPGASDMENSDSDDHFSDAQSGLEPISSHNSPRNISPTNEEEDSVISQGLQSMSIAAKQSNIISEIQNDVPSSKDASYLPQAFPVYVAENSDLSICNVGKISGTTDENHTAHSVSNSGNSNNVGRQRSWSYRSRSGSTPGDRPIPITKVERVDRRPSYGEVPGTLAYEFRKQDAIPDIIEDIEDIPVSPTLPRSFSISQIEKSSPAIDIEEISIDTDHQNIVEEEHDGEFGDDFDEFEEGEEDAEFGEFNDNFQEATLTHPLPYSVQDKYLFPVLDFTIYDSQEEILAATESHLNEIFPPENLDNSVLLSISTENSTFLTPRSASLWSQLVAPPPLQPPNWIQSRIRRLFLVSLGVPVDLDEILPASKQKKLILPSVNLNTMSSSIQDSTEPHMEFGLKKSEGNSSTLSLDSQGKLSRPDCRKISRPKLAPELDLVAARQLCATTNETLDSFSQDEMIAYTEKLRKTQARANAALEFWTERTDEKLRDRETFEGVIENLVKHARKTRK